MEFELFGEPRVGRRPIMLRLEYVNDGVALAVVDEFGNTVNRGNLLAITADGALELRGMVNPKLGFSLDAAGRLRLKE